MRKKPNKIPIDILRTGKENDNRRCGLTNYDRNQVKHLFFDKKVAIRVIARKFEKKCSRRTIQFILFPDRLKKMQAQHRAEKHHLTFYDKDKWRHYMRTHRQHKRDIFNKLKVLTRGDLYQ